MAKKKKKPTVAKQNAKKTAPAPEKAKGPSASAVSKACQELCAMALGMQGHVLYPKPKGMSGDVYNAAIERLAEDGLAHAGTNPNLTSAGVEAALKD